MLLSPYLWYHGLQYSLYSLSVPLGWDQLYISVAPYPSNCRCLKTAVHLCRPSAQLSAWSWGSYSYRFNSPEQGPYNYETPCSTRCKTETMSYSSALYGTRYFHGNSLLIYFKSLTFSICFQNGSHTPSSNKSTVRF